jgi:SSS family solute:Na+ symporter
MTIVLGVGPEWAPTVAAVSGMVAVVYASAGGMRAVVVTDFFQFLCLFAGALVTVLLVTFRMGGFAWWPTAWVPTWDVQPLVSFNPHVRATVMGAIVTQVLWNVCTAGGDQTAIQRYMSTTDARAARRAYLVQSVALIAVTCLLTLVGFSLLGYFRAHPELLPPGMDLVAQGDAIFPFFIARHLPVGLTGLVVAALFAAAMSSIDSGVNSIAAVVQTDFLDRIGMRPTTEKGHARFAQCLAFGIGVAIVAASSLMRHIPGNFLEMTSKTTNLLVTPIFGLFFLALFVPRATPLAAVAGCVYGVAAAVLVAYWDLLTGTAPLSFQWIGPVALAVDLVVAGALCRWGPRRNARAATWRTAALLLLLLVASVAGLLSEAHA